jgi:hypothetical protein
MIKNISLIDKKQIRTCMDAFITIDFMDVQYLILEDEVTTMYLN